jgi:beta-lactamase class A
VLAQQRLTAAVAPLSVRESPVGVRFGMLAAEASGAALIQQDGGDVAVAVAVDDLTTGAQASSAGARQFVTASIVKVDILATLLYQLQQAGQATPKTSRNWRPR